MKRFIATLTVAALITVAGVSAFAQGGEDAAKNRMLIAFNRAELSVDQLTTLQGLTQATIDAQAAVQAAQDAVQDFLINYTGSADDFDAALEAEQANVQAAREAFNAVRVANAEVVLDTLTAAQFNELENTLDIIMANDNQQEGARGGPQGQNGPGDNNGNNNQGDGPGGRGGPGGPQGQGGPGGNLDLLLEVIGEKIAALSA